MRITTTGRDGDLSTVDLFDPGLYAEGDPHPIWTTMRETAPLHRQTLKDGRSFASVTRYADACKVLGDSKAFTSERGSLLAGQLILGLGLAFFVFWLGALRSHLRGRSDDGGAAVAAVGGGLIGVALTLAGSAIVAATAGAFAKAIFSMSAWAGTTTTD